VTERKQRPWQGHGSCQLAPLDAFGCPDLRSMPQRRWWLPWRRSGWWAPGRTALAAVDQRCRPGTADYPQQRRLTMAAPSGGCCPCRRLGSGWDALTESLPKIPPLASLVNGTGDAVAATSA